MRCSDGMRVLCHRGSQKSLVADCVVAIRAGHSVSWNGRSGAGLCGRPYTALIDRHSDAIGRSSKRIVGRMSPIYFTVQLRRKRSVFSAVQSDTPGPLRQILHRYANVREQKQLQRYKGRRLQLLGRCTICVDMIRCLSKQQTPVCNADIAFRRSLTRSSPTTAAGFASPSARVLPDYARRPAP